jgi:acyl dehydratase
VTSEAERAAISTRSADVGRETAPARFELTPRLIAAYAAGIGDINPVYFDDDRPGGLVGHPGLIWRFQWHSQSVPGVMVPREIRRRSVAAFADARFTRPLREGDTITAQARLIAVRQIPPGVLNVNRWTMRDATGAVVCVLDYAGIVRGAHLEGEDTTITETPPLPQPTRQSDEPLWTVGIPIAREAAHVYTECADIWNPIHTERRVALAAGLPDIILHGSATLMLGVREIVNRCLDADPTRLRRFAGQFRAMVIPGTTITVRCHEDRREAGGRAIFWDVLNAEGGYAVANGVVLAT